MRHSAIPLPERSPALAPSQRQLSRLVEELLERHPDWTPEAIRRALFLRGLAADPRLLRAEVEAQGGGYADFLPMRLVKERLGLR
jgi:hypothetical protein